MTRYKNFNPSLPCAFTTKPPRNLVWLSSNASILIHQNKIDQIKIDNCNYIKSLALFRKSVEYKTTNN